MSKPNSRLHSLTKPAVPDTAAPPPPPTESAPPPPTNPPVDLDAFAKLGAALDAAPVPEEGRMIIPTNISPPLPTNPSGAETATTEPAPFQTAVADLTEADIAKLLAEAAPAAPARSDVALDRIAQPASISEQTLAELNAGRQKLPEVSEEISEVVSGAQASVMSRIHAEQEAGRAAVARKQGDIELARSITARGNARRLREGAAEGDDLSYNEPKG
jgi:hypothetical protein